MFHTTLKAEWDYMKKNLHNCTETQNKNPKSKFATDPELPRVKRIELDGKVELGISPLRAPPLSDLL